MQLVKVSAKDQVAAACRLTWQCYLPGIAIALIEWDWIIVVIINQRDIVFIAIDLVD